MGDEFYQWGRFKIAKISFSVKVLVLLDNILSGGYCSIEFNFRKLQRLWIKIKGKYMVCPICRLSNVQDNSGSTTCPSCRTELEIDDRGECVFVNTDFLRMPVYDQVCGSCGLIQQDQRESCIYCGKHFNKTRH